MDSLADRCGRKRALDPGRRALLGAGSLIAFIPAARGAQPTRFVEGTNYVRLEQPATPSPPPGKAEVVEFFWYECPHCNAFEPALEAWEKKLTANTTLRRVPVYFGEVPWGAQQRLYYALEASGQLEAMHRKVFRAIHGERRRLRTPEEFAAFLVANGGNPVAFAQAYASPAVQAKVQQARQLAAAYKIDAVPAMGVDGRWYTTGGLANAGGPPPGTNARMLDVVDALIARSRQRR